MFQADFCIVIVAWIGKFVCRRFVEELLFRTFRFVCPKNQLLATTSTEILKKITWPFSFRSWQKCYFVAFS